MEGRGQQRRNLSEEVTGEPSASLSARTTEYLNLFAGRLPAIWVDFVSTLDQRVADSDVNVTTGLDSPYLLHPDGLAELQGRVDASSPGSAAPFDTNPVVVADVLGFPVVAVGSEDDSPVFQVGTWVEQASLEQPLLLSLRLSSWLERLPVPSTTRAISERWTGQQVISTGAASLPTADLCAALEPMFRQIDLGPFSGEGLVTEEQVSPLDVIRGTRSLVARFGELPPLSFARSATGSSVGLDGQLLQHPLAALLGVSRVVAVSMASGAPVSDRLGCFTGNAGDLTSEQVEAAWNQLVRDTDLDEAVDGLAERIARLG